MRNRRHAQSDAGWPAVHALVERWAELPPASWRMLLAAEAIAPPEASAVEPDPYERWLIRDLVETAWALASRRSADPHAAWSVQAREALERLAWRVLEPRRKDEAEPDDLLHPVRWLRRG